MAMYALEILIARAIENIKSPVNKYNAIMANTFVNILNELTFTMYLSCFVDSRIAQLTEYIHNGIMPIDSINAIFFGYCMVTVIMY
ncbi:hypothetical protein B738_15786 [Photorhabdus temperata subsp. temperata M1021]|nr:hypothetical protein B738_15786 [Photorhabdus temperata subsp. temperata M1021]